MDYKRLISYIYSYANDERYSNVGFAKALVNQGVLKLSVSIRGFEGNNAAMLGVFIIVEDGGYKLIKLGDCLLQNQSIEYHQEFDASNLNRSGYTFDDIRGIAVTNPDKSKQMFITMWTDEEVRPSSLISENTLAKSAKPQNDGTRQVAEKQAAEKAEIDYDRQVVGKAETDNNLTSVDRLQTVQEASANAVSEASANAVSDASEKMEDSVEKVFFRADYVDAFDDDYFYDCIETSPEKLAGLNLSEKNILENSFLLHGYYNFRHVLFGRVRDNLDNTKYFIGVPGMYCNRERYMASIFGFNNFKKSHRSDYKNPCFGYWYQEI